MKRLFGLVPSIVLIIGCKSISTTHKATIDEAGTYYYLPKTILQIELESEASASQKGKFSKYSQEMIGLTPYSDTSIYKPSKIKVSSIAVPDDQALFLVKSKCTAITKTSSGIICSVNAPPQRNRKDNTECQKIRIEEIENDKEDEVLVFYRRPVVHEKHSRKVKRDTSAHDSTAVLEEIKVPLKSSDPDYDSALVYQHKLQQLESLLTDYTDCENCENAGATKVSLGLIKKLRRDYMALFVGSSNKQKITQQLILDDKILAPLKTEKEIRISNDEVLKKNNLQVIIQKLNTTSILKVTETKAGLAYRTPITVLITIQNTKTKAILFTGTREIALSGLENINNLPTKAHKVVFDEETGSVLKVE